MKQLQIVYNGIDTFREELTRLRQQFEKEQNNNFLFQIYSSILEEEPITALCRVLEEVFPDAPYMGCSTSGNIVDCQVAAEMTVVCTIFEKEDTKVRILQYDANVCTMEEVTSRVVDETEQEPWVKAIELFCTVPENSTIQFCEGLKDLRPEIQIFGGISCSKDITSSDSVVFSKEGGYATRAVVLILYGGAHFHVEAFKMTGWKPLGRKFRVTKSEGPILQELDGIPAYEIYRKYLKIQNDDNFFYHTLEFPMFYEHNETTILRVPVASNPDNSITMSSDVDEGSIVRISYGDPATIIESIKTAGVRIQDFQPDLLHIFSCAARRTFWTSEEPTYEIYPLKEIAPSSGFFSHGEFLRTKGNLNQHNVTLVIAAMREGDKEADYRRNSVQEKRLSKIPLASRLANFISATSLELAEMNQQLAEMNEQLKKASITDGLTSLYNRKEIQFRIGEALKGIQEEPFAIIMLDIDNFKQVNDTYGHQEGDNVIIALARILQNPDALGVAAFSAGRWGGEEFMLLLPGCDVKRAAEIAERIRECFAGTTYQQAHTMTVSLGVSQAGAEDTLDALLVRVDEALYHAKQTGKNKVVIF
ncbi:MAG: diguanylate cyclase [Bacteroides sp.]|nr:diguanylate cyclase [Bacteroides sp.]MCM1549097.1 diguanylate cyclase [Clostridium sp.]